MLTTNMPETHRQKRAIIMDLLFGKPAQLVSVAKALKGSIHPVLPHPAPHAVLGTPITGPWKDTQETLYVGLGCFWGAEKLLWKTPGVESTAAGYAGGVTQNPTYREVCTGRTNHPEVVQVVYDPQKITTEQLIVKVLEAHDPTQGFRQGNDVGTQYRSAIYTTTPEQLEIARRLVEHYQTKLADAGYGDITTEVMPLIDTPAGTFYLAEAEHQQYLDKNPGGYCPRHSTGIPCN